MAALLVNGGNAKTLKMFFSCKQNGPCGARQEGKRVHCLCCCNQTQKTKKNLACWTLRLHTMTSLQIVADYAACLALGVYLCWLGMGVSCRTLYSYAGHNPSLS
uniref:Uncharacterized protein n=1 Tax=Pyxicephalus adspersus TaxID=30357 RepID=A0AAV3A227_PYXAD|nr:TPA: hypothetical protein GDO54_003050 [Pyxicephalus adspersus]